MADIFGKLPGDYAHLRKAQELGFEPAEYQRSVYWKRQPLLNGKEHNFHHIRAVEGAEPLGYVMDNLMAFEAQVAETLYNEPSVADYISVDTSVPMGVEAHGYRIQDISGSAAWLDGTAQGTTAETTEVGMRTETVAIDDMGSKAIYTDTQLESAQFMGFPLDSTLVETATRECMQLMEDTALRGTSSVTGGKTRGLFNQLTRAANSTTNKERVVRAVEDTAYTADNVTPESIADSINDHISAIIEDSNGIIGRRITGEMRVAISIALSNLMAARTLSDKGSDISIQRYIEMHNAWTAYNPGNTLTFRPSHLMSDLGSSADSAATNANNNNVSRMVISVMDPRVAVFGVATMPRINPVLRKSYGNEVPVRARCAIEPIIKLPIGIRYVDGTG